MAGKDNKAKVAEIREEVGSRIKHVRTEILTISQEKLGHDIPHLEGNNLQVRVASIEQGKGSAGAIYVTLRYLYSQGININYLFGNGETTLRANKQASLFPENITDYLKEVALLGTNAQALIEEILLNTGEVQKYIEQTVEGAYREAAEVSTD